MFGCRVRLLSRGNATSRISQKLYGNSTEIAQNTGPVSMQILKNSEMGTPYVNFFGSFGFSKMGFNGSADNLEPPQLSNKKTVGFVGVGNMGSHMALNLLTAGHPLVVYDKNFEAMKNLEKKGAQIVYSCAEISDFSDVVVTMLPSSIHVTEAYLGKEGLLKNKNNIKPTLFIDSSTVDPSTCQKISNSVSLCKNSENREFSVSSTPKMVDAPVSGGVPGAKTASLTFMVGGPPEAVREAEEFLSYMGSRVIHCGPSGSGAAAKLCNNVALAIQMAGVSEALSLGQKLGLDPKLLSQIFNSSTAKSWSCEKYNPVPGVMESVPSSRNYTGGFSNILMVKDLKLALESAREGGVHAHVPLASAVCDLYSKMCDGDAKNDDFSSIFRHVYCGTGITGKPK